jgi:PAS domain S-box-containing protein
MTTETTEISPDVALPEELQSCPLRYRRLFESALDGMLLLDAATFKVIDVNPAVLKLSGYSRDEFLGKALWEIGLFKDETSAAIAFRELQKNGTLRYENLPLQIKGGERREVEFVLHVHDENGQQIIGGHMRDLSNCGSSDRGSSDSEQATVAGRESQQFLQSTLDAQASHIAVLDQTGKIIAVNKAWQRFLEENGSSTSSCGIGVNYLGVCDAAEGNWSDEAKVVAQGIRQVISGQLEQFCLEYPCHGAVEKRWFQVLVTRFGVVGPAPVVVAHENITKRKLAAEHLRRSEASLAEAQRLAHLGSWEWDVQTNTLTWSDELYRIYGLQPNQFAATYEAMLERIHPEDKSLVQETTQKAQRDHQPWEHYTRIIRSDGVVRVLHARGSVVVDENGNVVRTYGTAQDVTASKQAEDERKELYRREQAILAEAQANADRISRLQSVTAALAEVFAPEEVANVIAKQGMAAMKASTCTIVLLSESGSELEVLCAIGYPKETVQRWSRFPLKTDTPISEAARTGQPVWLESTEVASARYPHLVNEFVEGSGHCWASIPLLIGTEIIGSLGLRFPESEGVNEANRDFLLALAHQCAQALHRIHLFEQVRMKQERLQSLSLQLMKAQEIERHQIARELHDEVGQALTALKINIRSLQRKSHSDAVIPSLQESLAIIDGVLYQVRDLSLNLRPPMLDDLGLVAALNWSLSRQAERAGFAAEFFPDPQLRRLPAHIETTCYRVAQESLTNIVRHAQARNVRVEVQQFKATEKHKTYVELVLQDDGVGFNAPETLQRARLGTSFGLLGMQERVLLAGGEITVDSAPEHGTTIRICFPLDSPPN